MEQITLSVSVGSKRKDTVVIRSTLPSDATIEHAIKTVLSEYRPPSGWPLLPQNPRLYNLTDLGRILNQENTLSEVGFNVGILWNLNLTQKSDIELLFHLFDDTADTKTVFGYETYDQFRDCVPEEKHQNFHFHGMEEGDKSSVTVEFTEDGIGRNVQKLCISGSAKSPLAVRSWNWQTLRLLRELRWLDINYTEIGGRVILDYLPSKLNVLDLSNNQITRFPTCPLCIIPSNLRYFSFHGNKMTDTSFDWIFNHYVGMRPVGWSSSQAHK